MVNYVDYPLKICYIYKASSTFVWLRESNTEVLHNDVICGGWLEKNLRACNVIWEHNRFAIYS